MTDPALLRAELVVRTIAETAVEHEAHFCELDAAAGDGDLGYSLARGFGQLLERWDELAPADVAGLLKRSATILSGRIGGTSGPLWGKAFLRAGAALDGVAQPRPADVVAALRSALEGIRRRGQAEVGDKTLLDALVPAVDRLEEELAAGAPGGEALAAAATTAREAAEATRGMLARRGRAAYSGERSRASVDAGAVAVAVMLEAVAASWHAAELDPTGEAR